MQNQLSGTWVRRSYDYGLVYINELHVDLYYTCIYTWGGKFGIWAYRLYKYLLITISIEVYNRNVIF